MRPPIAQPIPGAQRTVWTAGLWEDDSLRPFNPKEWERLHLDWAAFKKASEAASKDDWKHVRIRYDRDPRGVIRYAELRSDPPLVASALLSPDVESRFFESLGTPLLLAIPNRYQAFLFPKLAGPNPSFLSREILASYRATAHPVSLELFEISDGRWKAVGLFENP